MNRLAGLLFTALPLVAYCQTREISGTAIYYAYPNQTLKESMAAAIEQARVKALGEEFGTLITQDILSMESDKDSYFSELSNAEVKGEWIEDLQPPKAKVVDTTPEGVMVIEAKVKGRAQAIKKESSEFEVLALRNGTDRHVYANTELDFKEGDKLYLFFKAPIDGYVAAWLIDEQQRVSCLLPHESSNDGLQQIVHDREYLFFSADDPGFRDNDEGLIITCDDEKIELDRLYVMFSPNPFVKPVDEPGSWLPGQSGLKLPRQLGIKEFTRWMTRVYARDKNMSRKVLRLRITR